MSEDAPNIDVKPGDGGRLVYDKARRTIVAERKSHKVMTPEEYAAMPIVGWHEVCRDVDGFGGVGVRYLGMSRVVETPD
jgi:hypothetical protein